MSRVIRLRRHPTGAAAGAVPSTADSSHAVCLKTFIVLGKTAKDSTPLTFTKVDAASHPPTVNYSVNEHKASILHQMSSLGQKEGKQFQSNRQFINATNFSLCSCKSLLKTNLPSSVGVPTQSSPRSPAPDGCRTSHQSPPSRDRRAVVGLRVHNQQGNFSAEEHLTPHFGEVQGLNFQGTRENCNCPDNYCSACSRWESRLASDSGHPLVPAPAAAGTTAARPVGKTFSSLSDRKIKHPCRQSF